MARIWKERFDSLKHSSVPDALPDATTSIHRHLTAPTLIPHEIVFVHVCSFTFRFDSKAQLERVLAFYEQKILPSSRVSESQLGGCDHWEAQRWFERLPQFLREEPKRQKVLRALREAVPYFDR